MIIRILCTALFVFGVICLLKLTPSAIGDDILRIIHKNVALKLRVDTAIGKKKKSKLQETLSEIHKALAASGNEQKFGVLCMSSIILFVVGCLFSVVVNNLLLLPVLGAVFGAFPFIYIKTILSRYNKEIRDELETALSIITTAYISCEDIVNAVEISIPNINQPVKDVFKKFLGQSKLINSNIKQALSNLKEGINNDVFHEWCDILIACQDNRTLKMTLQPIAMKLSDIRIVNAELEVLIYEPRREFYIMLVLVILNIPMLRLINADWFDVLVTSIPGKVVLAITGIVGVVTTILAIKNTQPIEFKK